jgi:hypothetical protein
MQHEKRITKLVHNLHSPVVARLQLTVEALENLAGRDRGFSPGGMMVWQILS